VGQIGYLDNPALDEQWQYIADSCYWLLFSAHLRVMGIGGVESLIWRTLRL